MNTTSNSPNKTTVPIPRPGHHLSLKITRRGIVIAACILILAGYLLMCGPGSTEQSFNPEIFSVRRVVVAPILCLAGYLLVVIGILRSK